MYCPNQVCHIKGTIGKFCVFCGTRLDEDRVCVCGTVVNGDKFCKECGREQKK